MVEHKIEIVAKEFLFGHIYKAKCSCGYEDPAGKGHLLTQEEAERSGNWHLEQVKKGTTNA